MRGIVPSYQGPLGARKCRPPRHLRPALLHHLGNLVRKGYLVAFPEQIFERHPGGAGNREFTLLPTADGAVAGD